MLSLTDFDYELADERIAQTPREPRDSSRLLDATAADAVVHRHVRDIADLVGPGDVLVVNNTRVLPARLKLFKSTGGAVEVMLIEPGSDGAWHALVRPSRRVRPGVVLLDAGGAAAVTVGADLGDGLRVVTAATNEDLRDVARRLGAVPLPPYITAELAEPERYQTIYAQHEASVAAPTAGLHFTPDLLERCRRAGAHILEVDLAVGIGTFRPIMVDDISDHEMHAETYNVSQHVLDACTAANRVIAVGTTTVRALESAAQSGELSGSTELFISPGFEFKVVDVLMTNFHQPKSSLLVMLAAFVGPRWRGLYDVALQHEIDEPMGQPYRFLSFGDAMIVSRTSTEAATNV